MIRKLVSLLLILIFSGLANAHRAAEQATAEYFATIKENPKKLTIFLTKMPKGGDLHTHLGGASLAENMLRYAKNDPFCINQATLSVQAKTDCAAAYRLKNIAYYPSVYNATIDDWSMRHFHTGKTSAHDHFFAAFGKYALISKNHASEMIQEVSNKACQQNILYLELMLTPDNNASGRLGKQVGWNTNLFLLRKKLFQHGLGLIVKKMSDTLDSYEKIKPCCDFKRRYLYQAFREQPPEQVFAQLLAGFELANKNSRVLGVNLVQAEDGKISMRDYTLHMQMIAFLHRLYPKVKISLHAGELTSALVPESGLRFHIRQAVEIAHANRIGHGVDIQHETNAVGLLKEMANKHILVEINLRSNEAILGVKGKAHPIQVYRRYNVPLALSTDDEGVLRTSLSEQYKKAVLNYDLSYLTVKNLARNSITYSFLPGQSLWKNDHYQQRIPVCKRINSAPCQRFLQANEKARLQWTLEKQFLSFENNYQGSCKSSTLIPIKRLQQT